jgi:uncharacterized RDD family membrane protein YckC
MDLLNKTTLHTPESVQLEFSLAGIGNRAWALLIDYTILFFSLSALILIASLFSYQITQLVIQLTGSTNGIELWLFALFFLISFAIYVGYFVYFETLWQGQTPGKRIAKIRVIRNSGRTVRLTQSVLRALLRPVDDFLYLGAFMIMFSSQEKRLGDWVAGTLVVQVDALATPTQLALDKNAETLAVQLCQDVNLDALLPDDFAVVREYLQRRKLMTPAAKNRTSAALARQVQQVIQLPELPPHVTSDLFLEGIYLAYQKKQRAGG